MIKTWTMRDGRKIPIRKMEDSHLINTIRLFERKAPALLQRTILEGLQVESMLQGDMAQFSVDQELQRLEQMDPIEFLEETDERYLALTKEANRRGLCWEKVDNA